MRHRALGQEARNVCFEARATGHGCGPGTCVRGRPARARPALRVAGWVAGGPPPLLPRLLLCWAGTLPAYLYNRCLTVPAKWIIPKPRTLGTERTPHFPTLLLANKPDGRHPLNPSASICVSVFPDRCVNLEHLPCAESTPDRSSAQRWPW